MEPTCEQRAAISTGESNLIVVAGAGSGKTRVLVERFLRLLEDNPKWRVNSLVAITFTRAAAAEMRHRLREELTERTQEDADGPWASHLSQLDRARIDTIHGLCADILRANAAQAGIDPKFDVLDENAAAMLLDDAVDDVLATIEAPESRLFAHYDAFRIENTLKQVSLVNALSPTAPDDPAALFRQWEGEWQDGVLAARDRLLKGDEIAELNALDAIPEEDKLGELIGQYRRYLLDISHADDAATIAELMGECRDRGAIGNIGSVKAWGGKAAKDRAAGLLRTVRKQIEVAMKDIGEQPGELDRATAEVLPLWHALLGRVRAEYRQRKSQSAQLDFDDLERLTAELLEDQAVQERYRGTEFKQLLVDEFQDTNTTQWGIITALADLERGGSLFLVGDPKQSIYQFRGADVSVFNCVRAKFAAPEHGRELPLSISFRAHRPLVEQYNKLFGAILQRDESSPVAAYQVAFDQCMTAARAEPPAMPAIDLMLLAPEDDDLFSGDGRSRPSADDLRRWEAYEIARRVKSLVARGQPVYDKTSGETRGMRYGDVALLFQSTTKLTIYEDVFKARRIPYQTIAGRGYYDRQEVWDMLDLLRFLHNAADDLSLASVLRSPLFVFSDDLLYALRRIEADAGEPVALWRALQIAAEKPIDGVTESDKPLITHALATLTDLRRVAGRATISELLRLALAKTNYTAVLTGLPDGARRRGNVEILLNLAEDSGKISLGKFSRYLTDLTTREVRESEAALEPGNALRLMTAHASKGLEFPLVILADAAWERGNRGAPTLLVDAKAGLSCSVYDEESSQYRAGKAHRRNMELAALKEEAERKRLLYVAATRAQDYLLISGSARRNKDGSLRLRGWLKLLIPALNLNERSFPPGPGERRHSFGGHELRLLLPSPPPSTRVFYQSASGESSLWEADFEPGEYPPKRPPLLRTPPPAPPSIRHLSATQLEDLGGFRRHATEARRRFREVELAADERRPPLAPSRNWSRLIGLIVHELLQFADFAGSAGGDEATLAAIAWDKGVTKAADIRRATAEAKDLLREYAESDVGRWIQDARAASRPVYTELPFAYRLENLVIHGVIDVLLRRADGEWVVIDYKTSLVKNGDFEAHARRYRRQLGVYAAALRRQFALERMPLTYVHYIRYNKTMLLTREDCQRELDQLGSIISELTRDHAKT